MTAPIEHSQNSNSQSKDGSPSSTSANEVVGVVKKYPAQAPISAPGTGVIEQSGREHQNIDEKQAIASSAAQAPPATSQHHSKMHYYHHPYHGSHSKGYEHTGTIQSTSTAPLPASDASKPNLTAPPPPTMAVPGPYTQAQYDTAKQPPPLPLPIPAYPGKVAPAPRPSTVPGTTSSPSSPQMKGDTTASVGREPPPSHHFHHAPMHGEHTSLPLQSHHQHQHPSLHHPRHHPHHPPHRHGYPPFREDMARGPPPPRHRGWHMSQKFPVAASHRYYDAPGALGTYSNAHGTQAMIAPPNTTSEGIPNSNPNSPSRSAGPYRFSDPTLRREALSNYRDPASESHVGGSKLKHPLSSTGNPAISCVDVRDGATSPSQIDSSHREEVTTMGCTCKKTKCLKLYCQCFAVKIYCGPVCRCMTCHNTATHENERQDAIRNILSRNPQAFETKFKKSLPNKTAPELSHKLGCKCRKSGCIKKYCECFAGNVKCSASCRCVGCKNMPTGGPSPDLHPPPSSLMGQVAEGRPLRFANGSDHVSASSGAYDRTGRSKSEPYMMNAAQNLAFLKHASPVVEKNTKSRQRISSQELGDVGSMPSLTSEESPSEQKLGSSSSGSTQPLHDAEPNTAEKTAANALLMAAFAMTEMSGQTPTKATTASTPPRAKKTHDVDGTSESYHTPQKNLLRHFQSPKRKQTGEDGVASSPHRSVDDDSSAESSPGRLKEKEESPKRENSGLTHFTPSVQQKIKRSRIESLQKASEKGVTRDMESETKSAMSSPMVLETPKQAKKQIQNELTPVSARCIDFKRMHVHETSDSLISNKEAHSPSTFQAAKQVAAFSAGNN